MDIINDLKNMVDTVKDSISEAGHKGAAEAERAKREAAGDSMTTGEKVGSVANEAKHNIAAGVDHTKVEVRKGI